MSESLPLRREGEPSPSSSIDMMPVDMMDEDMAEGMAYEAGPKNIRGARDLTTGPLFTTLLLFTLPTLASNILWSLNGSISSLWPVGAASSWKRGPVVTTMPCTDVAGPKPNRR